MSHPVQPAVEGLEEAFGEGTASVEAVTVAGTRAGSDAVAKRCQHCGEPVRIDADHTWAVVEIDRATGANDVRFPVFCTPRCIHEWSIGIGDSGTRKRHTVDRR